MTNVNSCRRLLAVATATAMALVAGCSSEAASFNGTAAAGQLPSPYGAPSNPSVNFDEHQSDRALCTSFGTGATTAKTIGTGAPDASAVQHVVVVMLENRSFDHMLSDLPAVGVTDLLSQPSADVTNPQTSPGIPVPRGPAADYCIQNGINHEWGDVHLQLNAGNMNGFVEASNAHAMEYYTHSDLPILYSLASNFAISDRHFSSLLGPTWPNRLFLFAASSCGYAEGLDTNPEVTLDCGATAPNIVKAVRDAHHSFEFYDDSGLGSVAFGLGISSPPRTFASFKADAASSTLPDVAFVGASTGEFVAPPEDDDHPPANVLLGETFLYNVVQALTANRATWAKTVLFITFDEHGGFYDHVVPPRACDPLGDESKSLRDYAFNQFGFRVPLIVVSPFARHGYVSHADTDHSSITRFIEHWLHLGALTARDANAWPFLDMFDFDSPVMDLPQLSKPATAPGCARGT